MAIRLDQLAARQFGITEQEAAAYIMEGRVYMGFVPADKPGTTVKDDTVLTLREKAKKYASRSGYKLEKASRLTSRDFRCATSPPLTAASPLACFSTARHTSGRWMWRMAFSNGICAMTSA